MEAEEAVAEVVPLRTLHQLPHHLQKHLHLVVAVHIKLQVLHHHLLLQSRHILIAALLKLVQLHLIIHRVGLLTHIPNLIIITMVRLLHRTLTHTGLRIPIQEQPHLIAIVRNTTMEDTTLPITTMYLL